MRKLFQKGITIVSVVAFPAATAAAQFDRLPVWRAERGQIIGRGGGGTVTLTSTPSAAVVSNGIAVAQPQEALIKLFGHDGQFLRSIGRPGDGPGDIRRLSSFGARGDTIWVADAILRRLSWFLPSGHFAAALRLDALLDSLGVKGAARQDMTVEAPLAGRRILLAIRRNGAGALDRDTTTLMLPRGGSLDTIAMLFGFGARVLIGSASAPGQRVPNPFSRRDLYAVAADGSEIIVVKPDPDAAGKTARVVLAFLDADGRRTAQRTLVLPVTPLDVRNVDLFVARFRDRVVATRAGGAAELASAYETAIRKLAVHPLVDAVRLASDGSVWLRTQSGYKGERWLIVSPTHEAQAWVQFSPEPFRVLVAVDGMSVWAVEHDEDDQAFLVKYLIRR